MAKESFATVIDRLVDFIQARGPTSVKEAAKALAMSEAQIEDIANVLAESGMLRVRYTLTGIFLEPKRILVQASKEDAKNALVLDARMKTLERELSETESSFSIISDELSVRIRKQEAELGRIEGEEQVASEQELSMILGEASRLEKSVMHFEAKMKELKDQLDSLNAKVRAFEERTIRLRSQKPMKRKGGFLSGLFSVFSRKRSG